MAKSNCNKSSKRPYAVRRARARKAKQHEARRDDYVAVLPLSGSKKAIKKLQKRAAAVKRLFAESESASTSGRSGPSAAPVDTAMTDSTDAAPPSTSDATTSDAAATTDVATDATTADAASREPRSQSRSRTMSRSVSRIRSSSRAGAAGTARASARVDALQRKLGLKLARYGAKMKKGNGTGKSAALLNA